MLRSLRIPRGVYREEKLPPDKVQLAMSHKVVATYHVGYLNMKPVGVSWII